MNNLDDAQVLTVENEYWVNMWEDLEGLQKDQRFQRLILGGYFKDKAINGVSLLANDSVVAEGRRPAIFESLIAISHLEDFFITVENLGSVMPDEDEEL